MSLLPNQWGHTYTCSPEENVKYRTSSGRPTAEPSIAMEMGRDRIGPPTAEGLMCHRCDWGAPAIFHLILIKQKAQVAGDEY